MKKKVEKQIIGRKIHFRDTKGDKHFGIIEDIIPDITGGGKFCLLSATLSERY